MASTADKNNNVRLQAWFVWLLGAVFFFYEFLLQIAPGVMRAELMHGFEVGATAFGTLAAFYFIAYASMQIPAGVLLDRFGPRRLLTFAAATCGFGTLIFAGAHRFSVVEMARFATGLGSAFAMLGALVITANWFPTNRFALLHGLLVTIGFTGALVGEAPLALLLETLHWRESLVLLGFIGVGMMLLIWLFIRDKPNDHQQIDNGRHHDTSTAELISGTLRILKHRQSWTAALYGAMMYAPTTALAWWGPSFFEEMYSIKKSVAALMISLMFLGWIIGSPLFGGLTDFLGRRKISLYISSVGSFSCLIFILYNHNLPIPLLGFLLFLFGFFSCGFVPSFALLREQHPARFSGTALGFMNMINSLGAAAAQPFIGIILDYLWDGKVQDGIRIFSVHNYQTALTALPISIGLSFFILFFLKETYCRTPDEIE